MRKPRLLYRRRFLNEAGFQTSAHLIVKVRPYEERGKRRVDTEFRLMDCNRVVDLDFWADSEDADGNRNEIYKAQLLRKMVNQFVDRYLEAVDWIMEVADD